MNDRIGFMQGRLSPPVDGRIQAFPWSCWREEFASAERHGFRVMEWTLDQSGLRENPLMTTDGRAAIRELRRRHGVNIPSVTGDCFMQAPFWKARGQAGDALRRDFVAVADACAAAGVSLIVVPLLDGGHLDSREEEERLVSFLQARTAALTAHRLSVAFESDADPDEVARVIQRLDPEVFGVNYDIGNSAALGFDPAREIELYGRRILGVHVKDRVRGGQTVPLGTGDADFAAAFGALGRAGYAGPFILQAARAADADHAGALCRYRDLTAEWLRRYAA